MFLLSDLLIPTGWLYVMAFGFGVIIGSFLNVYIYRFHTGKSLSGHSHCMSCGSQLRWYDLFPLLSYLALRGSCRKCGCRFSVRYFVVELLTGVLFVLALTLTLDVPQILLLWFMFSVLVVITVYDYYHFIIPDALTVALLVVVSILAGYQCLIGESSWVTVATDAAATLAGASFFLFLWLISQGRWLGFGDVKLAVPLGFMVGAPLVFSFVVFSFWIGAVISLLILGYEKLTRGKALLHLPSATLTMKSAVPFAPFLIASSVVTLLTHLNVLSLFSFT